MTATFCVAAGVVVWLLLVVRLFAWGAEADDPMAQAKLDERDRVACVLLEARGLTQAEISQRLRIPPAAVSTYLERSIEHTT